MKYSINYYNKSSRKSENVHIYDPRNHPANTPFETIKENLKATEEYRNRYQFVVPWQLSGY